MNFRSAMSSLAILTFAIGAFAVSSVTLQQGSNGYTGCTDNDMWKPGTAWGVYSHTKDYLLVELN